jgi:hypothetical protein
MYVGIRCNLGCMIYMNLCFFSYMLLYQIIWYLWPEMWLWRDGIWRRERPPYREIDHRKGWYKERPPVREIARKVEEKWIATSSPNALTVKQGDGVSCGKQVIEVDTNGEEYEKVTHARNVKQFGSISDFMVIRNIRTGEVLHLNVKYAGFGVSVNKGKFILRQKRERG